MLLPERNSQLQEALGIQGTCKHVTAVKTGTIGTARDCKLVQDRQESTRSSKQTSSSKD